MHSSHSLILNSSTKIMFALLALFLILFLFGIIYWYISMPKNLPPGPIGLPFLGNALEYRQGSNIHLIVLDHIRKYGPLFRLYMGNKLVIILGDYDCIQEALVKHGDTYAGRPQMQATMDARQRHQGIVFSEGDLWKKHRRFALSTLRDFGLGRPIIEPRIQEELEYLMESLQEYSSNGTAFNPQTLLMFAVSNVISQLIFGHRFSYDDKEFVHQFSALSKRISNSDVGPLSPFVLSDTLATLACALPFVRQYIKETEAFLDYVEIQVKKTTQTFDPDLEPTNYIHAYLKVAKDHDTFTQIQLLASCMELFTAGTETTSTTLRFALLFLASRPEIQERMYQEIKYQIGTNSMPNYADRVKLPFCEAVIMETQRFGNLAPFGGLRRTLAPSKLMGYDIPQDAIILPFLTNILHNPHLYPDPMKFDPYRFLDSDGKVIKDPKLIPFGAGKRVCLAESLARMELFIFLVGIISHFRFCFPQDQPIPTLEPLVGVLSAPVSYKIYVENRSD